MGPPSAPDAVDRLTRLTEFYRFGGNLMISEGDDLFDVLQLLEPQCNQSLSSLACSAQPRIPQSDKFQKFIDEELLNLKVKCKDPRQADVPDHSRRKGVQASSHL